MWFLAFHPGVRKDLRRLSKEAADFIVSNAPPLLMNNPYRGEPLRGPLRGAWKFRISEYRIAYSIDEKRRGIIILEVGARSGFYERLRKRLKK
jgi:addiction module RelE/StbE family toxin